MTDEQIEKALKLAIGGLSDCAQEQIFAYITRLKNEIVALRKVNKQMSDENAVLARNADILASKIRQETAKEVFTLFNIGLKRIGPLLMEEIANRCGIEVKNERNDK